MKRFLFISLFLAATVLATLPARAGAVPAEPHLSESQAIAIAQGHPGVPVVVESHPEMVVHASFSSERRLWTITWSEPMAGRVLVEVIVDDDSGGVVRYRVEDEAYHDKLPLLDDLEAIDIADGEERVQQWLAGKGEAEKSATLGEDRVWTVSFTVDGVTEAEVLVDDATGDVNEVRTGPQVAWSMARGYKGAFGRIVNEPYVWLPLCFFFLLPFVEQRRPLRWLHLDLLVLLSFSVSHYFFNRGEIFTSVPLVYPPLVYLLLRMAWLVARFRRGPRAGVGDAAGGRVEAGALPGAGAESRGSDGRAPENMAGDSPGAGGGAGDSMPEAMEPAGVIGGYHAGEAGGRPAAMETVAGAGAGRGEDRLALHLNFGPRVMTALLAALLVFRIVINLADSNVVDVGYSGVIGAQRLEEGIAPYGNMPDDDSNGDTYGPMNYLLYLPFELLLPWSGSWDDLPAAHAVAIFFDLAAVAGMYYLGRRLGERTVGGRKLGLALAYAWAAYPYTTFVLNCNVNDTVVAAFIVWGLVFLDALPLGALMLALATQVKFFPAMLAPLWASYPRAFRGWGSRLLFVAAFLVALAAPLPIIFLGDGSFQVFLERSLKWQLGRESPFSIWGQHPERLAGIQHAAQYILIGLAIVVYTLPPRKRLIQVVAATAALLLGFQLVQTHWFYLYIPWFFPAVMAALVVAAARRESRGGDGNRFEHGYNNQGGDMVRGAA